MSQIFASERLVDKIDYYIPLNKVMYMTRDDVENKNTNYTYFLLFAASHYTVGYSNIWFIKPTYVI